MTPPGPHGPVPLSFPRRFPRPWRRRSARAPSSRPRSPSRDGSSRRSFARASRGGGPPAQAPRLHGEVHLEDAVHIDFGMFEARLAFEDEGHRAKVLKEAKFRDGTFGATDRGGDIELKRWGAKERVLRGW